ncbi:MAG TPA: DUF3298 domain-containing protein [Dysgonamonadaceae bacterium]|jgi:hypothetical protein|nr:DUF3298 domain-containing protein [Dysgonamonadaceae bacterium]
MNKNHIVAALLAIFITTMFFSCKNIRQKSETALTFDTIVVAKQIPLLQENDTTLPYADVDIKFMYPVKFRTAEDLARLQQIFVGTFFNDTLYDSLSPQQAVDKYLENYIENYRALSKDYYSDKNRLPKGETPVWYYYQLNISNKIMFQNDSLLSYAVEYSDYTGGAHGSYRIVYYNIDLNDLVTISEEDLFTPGYYKPLTDIILHSLMEKYKVTSPDSLLAKGFFNIEDIVPNNNFWMDDKGLHYTYNQYEIAPYVMGTIDVTIPYEELKPILKPDNIIERFFPKKEEE